MNPTAYRAWDVEPVANFSALEPQDQLRHLVAWAVLAPNAHNSQPWHFELDARARTVRVGLSAEGVTPASDPTARQAVLGLGCTTETLCAAAEAYGAETTVELHAAEPRAGAVLATVHVGPSRRRLDDEGKAKLSAIRNRRVNRSKYDGRPVPDDFTRAAEQSALDLGVLVDFITDAPTRVAIAESQYLADRAVIALPGFRHELAELFLTGESERGRGMPAATLGINESTAARIQQDLGSPGAFNPDWAAGFAAAGRDGLRSSPLLVVASVEQDGPVQWMQTGRFFQRCALDAQARGLAVAVHAALVESTGLNVVLRTRLRRLARPTMVFRVGYATQERPHSPRLAASEVSTLVG